MIGLRPHLVERNRRWIATAAQCSCTATTLCRLSGYSFQPSSSLLTTVARRPPLTSAAVRRSAIDDTNRTLPRLVNVYPASQLLNGGLLNVIGLVAVVRDVRGHSGVVHGHVLCLRTFDHRYREVTSWEM